MSSSSSPATQRRRLHPAAYLSAVAALLALVAAAFSRALGPRFPSPPAARRCRPDPEGSWSAGVFLGDSPFALKSIEHWGASADAGAGAAWPVANPAVTCADVAEAGHPSSFVASPFLFLQGDGIYMFFETKNPVTSQGDIAAAVSRDAGATWQQLGVVLDEEWHLSYPYVFSYNGKVYMMPESSKNGDLRLYRALDFPLKWALEKVLVEKPLVDSVIIKFRGSYWLIGSDLSSYGVKRNGELSIWYSSSPLAPWNPHRRNTIRSMDNGPSFRNGGRPFVYDGDLYRIGKQSGGVSGHGIKVFRVEILTANEYKETEVPFVFDKPRKGRNAWNGARSHHLDVQWLPSSQLWIGVMDGDRVPSGDSVDRLTIGYMFYGVTLLLVLLLGGLIGAIRCTIPLRWCVPHTEKRDDLLHGRQQLFLKYKLSSLFSGLNKLGSLLGGRINYRTWKGRVYALLVTLILTFLTCLGTHCIFGGNGAEEPYPIKGRYSQFTLLTMTYDARLWNLKMFVEHYSKCASVREIVVVWNKGRPPVQNELKSAVPVRVRVEDKNTLNNRFNIDEKIKTRAVMELDDDIMMPCDDLERGFKVWREHPDRIVGYYPRLAEGTPPEYRSERYARQQGGYNMILTGAAFMDHGLAFERYWSKKAEVGRKMVDSFFNCEDVLLNFLFANASSTSTVEYVKPAWAIDMSKFSGVAISRNTQAHYHVRSKCLAKFSELYGNLTAKRLFSSRGDGWDV
ncbi:glucosamine inositolphosphorylceramide transferase 1-like [Hordeum vulgare subsp. vulgare]|uniref:glucosamine inositolphosphorylceramide transferase 1-like n=1 Tax=Hordeum vulgare subsp. vulgare TaxID=112509 RepID=UPI001D1A47B5|nr:glucosamine inositolphosphorylceramide transferase 1-like [Hordeum vulgare subsp. vulgare]